MEHSDIKKFKDSVKEIINCASISDDLASNFNIYYKLYLDTENLLVLLNKKIVHLTKDDLSGIILHYIFKIRREYKASHKVIAEKKILELNDINLNQYVDDLFEYVLSIPYSYTLIFPIFDAKSDENIENISLGKRFNLLGIEPSTLNLLNKVHTGQLTFQYLSFLQEPRPKYNNNTLAISIKSSGFVLSGFTNRFIEDDHLHFFKVIIALYICFDVFKFGKYDVARNYEYVCEIFKDDEFVTSMPLSYEDTKLISQLSFKYKYNFSSTEFADTKKHLIEKSVHIKQVINSLPKSFKSYVEDLQKAIIISAYWYYEISKANSEHTRLVYLTTAFDAYFKEDTATKESKSKIISLLIGDTIKEQNEVYKNLVRLYKLRNNLVHGKRAIHEIFNPEKEQSVSEVERDTKEHLQSIPDICTIYLKNLISCQSQLLCKEFS